MTAYNLSARSLDMAKQQTRRSVSVSRPTYERLKAYCEVNDVSMSEVVEQRLGDFLGRPSAKPRPEGEGVKMRPPSMKTGHIFTF